MIKIAICDEKKRDRAMLKQLVQKTALFQNAEYKEFDSEAALADDLECGRHYDIVFLDTKGIETGHSISFSDTGAMIIFVAEDPDHAIQAFDCNAFHYILKSDSYEKFLAVLTKAYKKYQVSHSNYLLKCKEGPVCLPLSEICYIEYCNKHLIFYTDKESYVLRGSIGTVAEDLADFGFALVHQGFVVNLRKIHRFLKTDIILTNGMEVMMSSRKRNEVIALYTKFMEKYAV